MRAKGIINEAILLSYCKLNLVTVQTGLLNSPEEGRRKGDQPLELSQIKVPVLQPGALMLIRFLLRLMLANGDLVTHFLLKLNRI